MLPCCQVSITHGRCAAESVSCAVDRPEAKASVSVGDENEGQGESR
jgi:hypothetical protein